MAIVHMKAFPKPFRIDGVTVSRSLELAKKSLYEAWFNALVLSPFYQDAIKTNTFLSPGVKRTYDLFGNLNGITFEKWWSNGGYRIFKEIKPFNRVSVGKKYNQCGENIPVLLLEIPLDVSPQLLREQIEKLLKEHHPNYKKYDRWKTSTAKAKLKATRLTFQSIDICLRVYKKYLEMQKKGDVPLYKIGEDLKLNPKLNVLPTDLKAIASMKKIKMSNAVSEYLEKAKNLIAHATECNFPVTTDHPWYQKKKRAKKSKYDRF